MRRRGFLGIAAGVAIAAPAVGAPVAARPARLDVTTGLRDWLVAAPTGVHAKTGFRDDKGRPLAWAATPDGRFHCWSESRALKPGDTVRLRGVNYTIATVGEF